MTTFSAFRTRRRRSGRCGGGHLSRPPALLWLAAVGLVALGAYGRLLSGQFVHAQFLSNPFAFLPARPAESVPIGALVAEKQALLARLEPGAHEAVFALAPHHWLRRPLLSARYARLAWREERLVRAHVDRARGPHELLQRWWRMLLIVLAFAVLFGLLAHVLTVTFFAGYAAEGVKSSGGICGSNAAARPAGRP